jgi:hypothetical protein
MMRMEIDFEQRGATLFATMRRDPPNKAAPAERDAHDRVWNALVKFCAVNKIGLCIPATEPKPKLSAEP